MVKEFGVYNISQLIDVLNNVDNFFITLTVGDLQDRFNKRDTLGENILYLIGFKHFVKSNVESD